jgi:hypothetical protein
MPSRPEISEAKRFQLNEIRRNLAAIDTLIHSGAVILELGSHLYRKLLVTSEVYRQQQEMYAADCCRTANRIVNLAKLHMRPIVRGKAGKKTEFGAKISISDDKGFVDLDRIGWDNCNEANDQIQRIEQYKQERGYCPERVRADAIYITAENKRYCAEHNIRLSGRGRGKRVDSPAESAEQQDLFKSDLRRRSVIEGRIGTSKRKYGLDLIMTKLVETSKSVIGMALFLMKMEKILRAPRKIVK